MAEFLLEMRNITKRYGENAVLKNMSLCVKPGQIHSLLGENGAGKSTLMNILFGMPVIQNSGGFEGKILWDGKPVTIAAPQDAMELGIGMVHQEFMMIPGFSIAENIKLNREPKKNSIFGKFWNGKLAAIDFERMNQEAKAAMKRVGIDLDETIPVEELPVGYKQFIEIAREIDRQHVKLLVFDEPTAVLTESETAVLLNIMKKLAADGIAIIFITHRLDEVMETADAVTIARDGEMVGTTDTKDTDKTKLAEMIIGREMRNDFKRRTFLADSGAAPAIELTHFAVDMPGEVTKDITLSVQKGEIFGLAGLAGQGKISVANGIMGIYPVKGELRINGKVIKNICPETVLKEKCAFVSEDRRGTGLLLDSSIEDNITVAAMKVQKKFIRKLGPISQVDRKAIREKAEEMIQKLDIRCTGPSQFTRRLSGGNQQKVCMARALTLNPEILLVSEPTRGIDIGAKRLLMEYLVKINKEQGTTIIITSSELAELRDICDRIAIIFGGKVAGILDPKAPDSEYGLMMTGSYSGNEKEEDGK